MKFKNILILGIVFFILFSSCVTADLTTDLEAYYKCEDDTTSTTITDELSNANMAGSANTNTFSNTGKIDKGFYFNQASYATFTTPFNLWESDFTITGWFKAESTVSTMFAVDGTDYNPLIKLVWLGNSIDMDVRNTGNTSASGTGAITGLSQNTWYFFSAVHDLSAKTIALSIAGTTITQTYTGELKNTVNGFLGSRNAGSQPFDGTLDESAIWSRALTSTELTELYNSGDGFQYPLVTNNPPSNPTDIVFNPTTVYANTDMEVNASGSIDPNNDTFVYHYQFYDVNDTTILQAYSTNNSFQLTSTQAHHLITVYAIAIDNNSLQSGNYSEQITLTNTLPTTPTTISGLPASLFVGDVLNVTGLGSTDLIDNDTLTYEYKFYNQNDSTILQDWGINNSYKIVATDIRNTILIFTRSLDGYGVSPSYSVSDFVDGANVDVRFTNEYDNSIIDIFSLTFANGTTLNTINNSILFQTENPTETFNISSTGFISQTFNNYLINDEINLTLYQALIEVTVTEKITGTTINSFNITDGTYIGTTTNGTAYFLGNVGSYTLTIDSLNYFNEDYNINLTALEQTSINQELGNVNLTVNAYYVFGNTSISNFTITATLGTYSESKSTTTGSLEMFLVQDDWTLSIVPSDDYQDKTVNITLDQLTKTYNFYLYFYNSVNILIYNLGNNSLMEQLVSISTISPDESFINTTTNGSLYLSFLTPVNYELRFVSDGFNPISKFIKVTDRSTQNMTVYMTSNATTELQQIQILDTSNTAIEGAIVWLQEEIINGTSQFLTIQEAQTNSDGKTTVWIEKDVTKYYRFVVIYNGEAREILPNRNLFTTKTSFIPNLEETLQLVIDIQGDDTEYIEDILAVSWNVSYPSNDSVKFIFIDGRNSVVGGRLQINGKYINSSDIFINISTQTVLGSSGTLEYTFPIINNTIYQIRSYIIYEDSSNLVYEAFKEYNVTILIEKNTGILFAVLLLIVTAFLTVKFGALTSSIITFGTLLLSSQLILGWINIPVSAITSIIALVIIFFFKPRGQTE